MVAQGACMVAPGGHAWLLRGGGVHGFIRGVWFYSGGGVCGFFSFFGYNEIRSMSGRYASYWNTFLFSRTISLCSKLSNCLMRISLAISGSATSKTGVLPW